MKILLVKPPSNRHLVVFTLGLSYISAYLKSKTKDIDIYFLDCLRKGYDHQKFSDHVRKIRPDVVGITALTMEIESALECCKVIKGIDKTMVTVIGGAHASVLPEETLSNKDVDFIFRGESEIAFYEFIQELKNVKNFHKVSNLGYKENSRIILNPVRLPGNLDELPCPDYELMEFNQYPKTYKSKYHPSAPLITSRGCPFTCTFCSAGQLSGKKFRTRNPENIIKEIKFLKDRYDIKGFEIWDDNFTLNRKRALDFCDLLIKENINLPWWCPNGLRIETLDEELMRKAKDSGLYAIAVGIESGSEKIQKDMKKNLNFEKVRNVVRLGKRLGIRMEGFFILGYPTETKEDILKTIKFSKELPFKRASILLFQPLAGSEIYEILKKEGRLKDIDCSNTEYSKPSILPQGFKDLQELKKLQRKAILEFYLRPGVFMSFLIENLTIDQLKEVTSMVKKYIFNK